MSITDERNLPLRVDLPGNVTARYRYNASGQRLRSHTHSTQVFEVPDGERRP